MIADQWSLIDFARHQGSTHGTFSELGSSVKDVHFGTFHHRLLLVVFVSTLQESKVLICYGQEKKVNLWLG